MRKVLRTEVEELEYCDENTEISGDGKMSLLSLYNQERVVRRFCQLTDQIFFVYIEAILFMTAASVLLFMTLINEMHRIVI